MPRTRLDALLARRGHFESRTRAAASVMAGEVHLGHERRRAEKPGQLVPEDIEVDVAAGPRYASRGGIKLANALTALDVGVAGRRCLDVGASTGGFTDCLLENGAAHVVALDVAYGELHWRLRTDDRVTVVERCNARALTREQLPYAPDLVVVDVSFIALAKVLPAVLACCAPHHEVLALVKPQFELGPGRVARGGVVRDPADRLEAVLGVIATARDAGARCSAPARRPARPEGQPRGVRPARRWLAAERERVEAAAREAVA